MDSSHPSNNCLHALDNKIKLLEDSARELKAYRNTLVPILRLPPEILYIIFKLSLPPSFGVLVPFSPIAPSTISHVCHQWRDISLNMPYLWSYINFTWLTSAGTAEMLARSKMAPLHLEARTMQWSIAKFEAFNRQIDAHIDHTRHLSIMATPQILRRMFKRLVSSAPSLEHLSIANSDTYEQNWPLLIPDNFFDGIAPKLVYLRLDNCGICWESPLLKGLRDLKLLSFPRYERATLKALLDALNQIPQLERLSLHGYIPIYMSVNLEPGFNVVLSSLTELDISAFALGCRLLLTHLVLPALVRLCVKAQSDDPAGRDVQNLVPYVARNAHGPHDTEALQSLFIGGNKTQTEFVAWTKPREKTDDWLRNSVYSPNRHLPDRIHLARVAFSTLNQNWPPEMDIPSLLYKNTLLTAFPLNSITSLTVKGRTPLSKQVWCTHASMWHKLKRVRLSYTAVPAFREMLEVAPREDTLLLPSLEELVLIDVYLDAKKVYYLYHMLIELVELKISLRTLDLRTCIVSNRAVQLLREIVVDVQGPAKKESGTSDLEWEWRGIDVVGEERGRDEEEHGLDGVPPFLGSWGTYDSDDNNTHNYDIDYSGDDETSSTDSEYVP
ncbi:hypothetical protein DFH94DRAFT_825631 [Russula ochroleuca]|uniref:F-box domain-containing protein n=1 Tax=Russula ochroleuca TaxID=152965 RepID=A0A9P5TAL1_9AGAM|nr:hypothetical protein DFH94DRAFT_825631 [Russula ochroleuca]